MLKELSTAISSILRELELAADRVTNGLANASANSNNRATRSDSSKR